MLGTQVEVYGSEFRSIQPSYILHNWQLEEYGHLT
jgi:hypothetical protein